jgi:hypothetical protein
VLYRVVRWAVSTAFLATCLDKGAHSDSADLS